MIVRSHFSEHFLLLDYVFFFQAEDGIRDLTVTGVQTCALPILPEWEFSRRDECFIAAAELARRQRDMDLAEEAVELLRTYSRQGSIFLRWAAHREIGRAHV